jgi:ubiquinone/menaquinone biosynthesis C-methylase UbiE
MDHLQRTAQEFTRQAKQFASSPAITAAELTARFVDAVDAGPDTSILDVACGPGIVTASIAAKARTVVAFDLTPEMLQQARERCTKAGFTNVSFEQGSAAALPFPDNSFDGVVTRLSIHHFDTPRRVLDEMFRVLKPGEKFVIADVVSSADAAESDLHNAIEVLRDPSHVRMLPATQLAAAVERAGFAITTQATWDKKRGFEEWVGIVADPERVAPLRTLVRALARSGEHAGMGLALAGDEIVLFHRWHLITARKSRG